MRYPCSLFPHAPLFRSDAESKSTFNRDRIVFVAVVCAAFLATFTMFNTHLNRLQDQIAHDRAQLDAVIASMDDRISMLENSAMSAASSDVKPVAKLLQVGGAERADPGSVRGYFPGGNVDSKMMEDDSFNVRVPTRKVDTGNGKFVLEKLSLR